MSWVAAGVAAFTIISGAQQAETMQESAALQKEIDEMNAEYAELDAYEAQKAGYSQEARYESVIDQTVATQKVALAAQDVDITFGTAKEIQNETRLVGFLNVLDIRNNAQAVAKGYKNQARNYRLHGESTVSQASINASATRRSSVVGAVSGYLSSNTKGKARKTSSGGPYSNSEDSEG